MRVRHYTGVTSNVPEGKARILVAGGSWIYVDAPSEKAPETEEKASEGEGTPEASQAVLDAPGLPEEAPRVLMENELPAEGPKTPSIPEIRKWALENDVEGAKPQGKLARSVIQAYMDAHKE